MNKFILLVRRELWEHRALWLVPVVFGALLVAFFSFGSFHTDGRHFVFSNNVTDERGELDEKKLDAEIERQIDEQRAREMDAQKWSGAGGESMGANERPKRNAEDLKFDEPRFKTAIFMITFVLLWVNSIVAFFYLLDCLLTERRDRSILFWKSLPISDTETVLSKWFTGSVLAPYGVILLAVVVHALIYVVGFITPDMHLAARMNMGWDMGAWFECVAAATEIMTGAILWYTPITGYLLLISVWARRNAFIWAVVPPLGLLVMEKLLSDTNYVGDFIARRFSGFGEIMGAGKNASPTQTESISLVNLLVHYETWISLAVAGALVFAAIRIRRYRDES